MPAIVIMLILVACCLLPAFAADSATPQAYTRFDAQGNILVKNKPFFPIGLYIYEYTPKVLAEVLSQGFNTVIYGVTPKDLPNLRANQLYTIPYPTKEWLAVRSDPAILTWYLADEPEGHDQSPAMMRAEYERVRAIDPTRPIGLCHFLWEGLMNYKDSSDYVLSDVYPIMPAHDGRIISISDHIDRLHSIHGPNFPVWPVIQIFGGPNTDGGKWGIPTSTEVRMMTYLALAHGAKGMMFFSYFPHLTDTWAGAKTVVAELKRLSPFLVSVSKELAVKSSNPVIHCRCIGVGQSGLVILVNPTNAPIKTTVSITDMPVSSIRTPEGVAQPVTNGGFATTLAGYGVNVYQWGSTPKL